MASRKLLSVCIPTYEIRGLGPEFLGHSLEVLARQTFTDFDVVISDSSRDQSIRNVCAEYQNRLDLHYFRNDNPVTGLARNTNNAILKATGQLIKIIFQDDFLYDEHSLAETVKHFDLQRDRWLVTACIHTDDGRNFFRPHPARYNHKIHLGKNTIGSPSVLTIKNDHPFMFDVNLKWLVDCDYYKRCFEAFGSPKVVEVITTVIRLGNHQITNTEATETLQQKEYAYVTNKYQEGRSGKRKLPGVTVVAVTSLDPTKAIRALQLSMERIEFHEAVLIAPERPTNLPSGIVFKQCRPADLQSRDPKNTNDYSKFILYRLQEYIDSDFALIVHHNAFVIRPEKWTDTFLEYDYIGAPWPKDLHFTPEGKNVRVGNGGFSLRSKKLLNVLNELHLPFTDNGTGYFHEDGVVCVYYRKQLENHGIKFAPVEVASRFSREIDCEDSYPSPFGFHNNIGTVPKKLRLRLKIERMLSKL